jgi:KaiC/GvpD/RAD55 family RecA-like ATPase
MKTDAYFKHVINVIKSLPKDHKIIFVTTNKPYGNLVSLFKQAKIKSDKFFFIDCISKTIGDKSAEFASNCMCLDNPQNLTLIGISITESIKKIPGKKILFLDSMSTLITYHDVLVLGRFSNFVLNKMRSLDVETVILALESDSDKQVIQQLSSIVDEVKK